nr:exocyst complex component SEC8-like [Ipomoea batatas]
MDSRQQRREGIEAAINFLNLILGFVITIKSLQYVHLIKLRGVLFYKILEDLHTHLYHKGEHRSGRTGSSRGRIRTWEQQSSHFGTSQRLGSSRVRTSQQQKILGFGTWEGPEGGEARSW